MICKSCKGTGIFKRGSVLGWGIKIPDLKCRDCLGTGKEMKKEK